MFELTVSFASCMVSIRASTISKCRSPEPGPEPVVLRRGPTTIVPLKVTVSAAVLVCTVTAVIVEVAHFVGGDTPEGGEVINAVNFLEGDRALKIQN